MMKRDVGGGLLLVLRRFDAVVEMALFILALYG